MEFSHRLIELMNIKGVSAYRIYKDLGIPDSLVGYWKKGKRVPSSDQLLKLSEYFGVSTDYLLGNEQTEKSPVEDDEAFEYLKELYQQKIMFKTKRKATKKDIEKAMEGLRFDLDYPDNDEK